MTPTGHRALADGRLCEAVAARPGRLALLREAYVEESPADHRGFVSALISHVVIVRTLDADQAILRGRRLSYREADGLGEDDRAVMRACISDAAGLPTNARSDADLTAVLEAAGAFAAPPAREGLSGVVSLGVDAFDGLSARLQHALRGVPPEVVAQAMSEGIEEALAELRAELDELRQQPLFFVVRDLPASQARALLLEHPAVIESLADPHAFGATELIARARAAIEQAPHLQEPQREDLRRGLTAIEQRDLFACRHLLAGLEGALWATARATGVIDDHMTLVHSGRPRRMHVRGVGTLLRPDGGLAVGTDLAVFLLGAVFNDHGNDIRHGRATTGHRACSVWSFLGVLGWLDRFAGTSLVPEFRRALRG
jgi:hypothetical protein